MLSAQRIVVDPKSISSQDGDRGMEIYVPGYQHDAAANDESGTQVFLEIIRGKLRVHVWNGGEDPVASIDIPRLGRPAKTKPPKSLVEAARAVIASADNTGCSEDLTVVSQEAVASLEAAVRRLGPRRK